MLSGAGLFADEFKSVSGEALIVVGAGGSAEYLENFQRSAERWNEALQSTAKTTIVGASGMTRAVLVDDQRGPDRQQILDWIANEPSSLSVERWIIFIGHGTYQLKVANFNLTGPDLSADELAKAIESSQSPWRIFVCSSCSSPFIPALSGPNRIVITATKSGSEQNYSRFAEFFSRSIGSLTSDLDHDGRISILEAFLVASRSLSDWYADEGRLATEQALLDDNGDKRGTPASFFRGIRAAKAPADGLQLDGKVAHRAFLSLAIGTMALTAEQAAQAAAIEEKIDAMRVQKSEIDEATYYAQLEPLMLELARIIVP